MDGMGWDLNDREKMKEGLGYGDVDVGQCVMCANTGTGALDGL